MQCIDGCVFPFPTGSHSISRIISDLRELGFTGAVLCDVPGRNNVLTDFLIFSARYIRGPAIRDIQKEIQMASRDGSLSLVRAGEAGVNRTILTTPGVHVLCDLHNAPKNSFDRVCAQNAADRNVAIDIRVSPLRELRGVPRQRVIRLYEEILNLQRRYEFPLIISSGAHSPAEMRSPRAIEALLSDLGMEKELIERAFSTIPDLINGQSPVRRVVG